MKHYLLASVATLVASAFMSDAVEVVTIKGKGGDPVRVNKSDYDADQRSDKPTMKLHGDNDETEQAVAGVQMSAPVTNLPPVAAPAAPDFSGGGEVSKPVIDPNKEAVAPTVPSVNQRLVKKEGTKAKPVFFVIDGTGARLEIDGVDKDGYPTEADAWNAIMALPH